MSPIQQLVADLQRELIRLGKIPAVVKTGKIELNMNEAVLSSVQPTYHAKIEKDVDVRPTRA